MVRFSRSIFFFFNSKDECTYLFNVIFTLECPKISLRLLISNPSSTHLVAKVNVDHVGISVYSDMLEKFIKRFGFEYKGLNPAKGKVYEATIKALKHNSLVKKRYPHFCQKDSLDPDE